MTIKIIINTILVLLLFITQTAFLTALPSGLKAINLILIVLILMIGLLNFKTAQWWALALGLLLDLYSFLPFGFFTLSLVINVYLINWLIKNIFTDRSLYSFLALITASLIIYELVIQLLIFSWSIISEVALPAAIDIIFWKSMLVIWGSNLITITIVFYMVSFLSAKLHPARLIRRHK
jgi:cell shape-determining protein MreD